MGATSGMEAGLQAMGGMLGTVFGAALNSDAIQSQNIANKELAKYAYDQERQMIAEQNRYNSPLEQLKRYQAAGLNPNLIYGEGKASAGNQTMIPQYRAPEMRAPTYDFGDFGIGSAVQTLLSMKQLELQNRKTEAEVERMQMENRLTEKYIGRAGAELDYYNLTHKGENSPAFIKDYSQEISLKSKDLSLRDLSIVNSRINNEISKFNREERRIYVNNILPLVQKLKQMEIIGYGYENAKREIDAELWRDIRNAEIMSNPIKAASHLGVLFGNTDIGRAFKDVIHESITDPVGTFKKHMNNVRNWFRK